MQIIKPSSILSPFIAAFMVVQSDGGLINHVFPDTSVMMIIRFRGNVVIEQEGQKILLPPLSIGGLSLSSRLIHYGENSGNILVQFKPAGATAFFKTPLNELFNSHVSLDAFFSNSEIKNLDEKLSLVFSTEEKVKVIEGFLISKLRDRNQDELILNSILRINAACGSVKMIQLATALNISQDAFEKRFRKVVGSTPKQYASIVRMRSLIDRWPANAALTEVALEAGFFDQSHFIKEFRKFTGMTPSAFFRI
ncbi:helix-turn-helix domain-containing protein [Mucilaginibacter sp. SMC90]|uniref:helix-turn-helix domain-containing protein n=1 Tax=Mucilaginibacter sp. SMC90 TaxID=2929803 RepID=UPI001FB3CBF2|nr:helix-turn-helix domain-containing protein [Mucilaginibacter sp. SMC90]UOE47429.1 helix-turn-helix domain-containing protein [Mucilaginibacter sp. SMC90]